MKTKIKILLVLNVWLAPFLNAEPLLVSIDNPQFRKLVTAIPSYIIDPSASLKAKEAIDLAHKSREELQYYLSYSGLFNIISESAYVDILDTAKAKARDLKTAEDFGDLESIRQWKTLGVESLTVGRMVDEKDGLKLEFRTYDVNRQKIVLGKRYGNLNANEITKITRRYANLLLELYTEKPGLFDSKFVFIGKRHKDDFKQVYICDFNGSNLMQITNTNAIHLSPHFSPDGKYITFTSFERKNPDLYLYEIATGRTRVISNYKGINSGAQWSPDSKLIVLTGSDSGDTDLFLLNPFRGHRRKLIKGVGLDVDGSFSPDKKQLAFVSGRFGNPHIFVSDLEWGKDDNLKVISDTRLTYAGWYNSTPAWSPDSGRIVFAGYDKDIDRYDIFVMDRDGKNLERLTLKTGDNESPSYAPNGQMIVFQSNRVGEQNIKGRPQLWVMNKDGSGQRRIETGLYEAQTPEWSGKLY